MKELEDASKDRIEISVKQQKEVKYSLIGNIVPHEGHTLWEIEIETMKVTPAKYAKATYQLFGENKREVITKPGCVHISALNKKNALKKFNNGTTGGKIMGSEKLPF